MIEKLILSELKKCPFKVSLYPYFFGPAFCCDPNTKTIHIPRGVMIEVPNITPDELYLTQVIHEIGHARLNTFDTKQKYIGFSSDVFHEEFADRYVLYRLRKIGLENLARRYILLKVHYTSKYNAHEIAKKRFLQSSKFQRYLRQLNIKREELQ